MGLKSSICIRMKNIFSMNWKEDLLKRLVEIKRKGYFIDELIEAGFEAVVVTTKKDVLGPEWLGRKIDYDFVRDISKIKGVDISGEGGEYHTFVVSVPIFRKRINILKSEKITRDQHCFLDILECELAEKWNIQTAINPMSSGHGYWIGHWRDGSGK